VTSRAKREAKRVRRHREQVARLIAMSVSEDCFAPCWVCEARLTPLSESARCSHCNGSGRELDASVAIILAGAHFDVALAREYGERFVEMEKWHDVLVHWTADRGLGPDNKDPGAFGPAPHPLRFDLPGGWPGTLAREFSWERCSACEGRGREAGSWAATRTEGVLCECADWTRELGEPERAYCWGDRATLRHASGCSNRPPKCSTCKGSGRARRAHVPPSVANGVALARLGRRLLDAIDGQPSECPSCDGAGGSAVLSGSGPVPPQFASLALLDAAARARRRAIGALELVHEGDAWEVRTVCEDCRGTGHNLAGVLPPITYSPQVRAAMVDALEALSEPGENRGWGRRAASAWQQSVLRGIDVGLERGLRTVVDGPAEGFRRLAIVEREVACGRSRVPYSRAIDRTETRVGTRGHHTLNLGGET
jgi:hypothetical protein